MVNWSNKGQARGYWPEGVRVQRMPHNPDAGVITNIGMGAECRRDRFCRCRKCKPPLQPRRILSIACGAKAR